MPLILNIETATEVCSVALARDGKLLSIRESNSGFTHSENITVFISEIIHEAEVSLYDLDGVAVSKGPGSYTGLRIGVSTAKGLCFAIDKPLISVPTLVSLTNNFFNNKQEVRSDRHFFCPMLDARRMEVYCAVYDSELNEVEPTSAKIIEENSFQNILETNTVYFFGNGASKCKSIIKHSNAVFVDDVNASASSMISLSGNLFAERKFEDVAYFEPFYLKDFVAK
ncbi:MAG: tRNA (adenosine(37)-N6)-threonylcarbamoyltransferase complex dimerization subunit type 1 TsaB [Bacteroidia bacterium]|nr:tRNA (adenosine(37)-N6)-threonylcarbamoyltransferase complex dimerization subunit type 1 TsaB [Bacteroidia bacterium]